VSLGDSLSTGVQPIGLEALQFRTDSGYADQLCALAQSRLPGLRAIKLGFPGESTSTMLDGSLNAYPHGNQLAEAVAFLTDHRGEVAFVTIDIGPNDFPARDFEALAPGLESIARNLPGILDELVRAAGPATPVRRHDHVRPVPRQLVCRSGRAGAGPDLGRPGNRAHQCGAQRLLPAPPGCAWRMSRALFSTTDSRRWVSLEGVGTVTHQRGADP